MTNNKTISTSFRISTDTITRLEKISIESGWSKADLISNAVLDYNKDPDAYPFNVHTPIAGRMKVMGLSVTRAAKDILDEYRKQGIISARFINGLILSFPWEKMGYEKKKPGRKPAPQKQTTVLIHSTNKEEFFRQVDSMLDESNKLLRMFVERKEAEIEIHEE